MRNPVFKTLSVIAILGCVGYAVVSLEGPNGIPELLAKRHQIAEYEAQNQQILRENTQKEERIDRLENNSVEQEMEIRQRLKLAKPGEKIFILDDSSATGNKK